MNKKKFIKLAQEFHAVHFSRTFIQGYNMKSTAQKIERELLGKMHDALTETQQETKKDCMSEDQFEQFWDKYPRKIGKKAAMRKYKLLPSELHDNILQSLSAQIKQWDDPKFIPHPTTWLNQGRWEDEVQSSSGYSAEQLLKKYNK